MLLCRLSDLDDPGTLEIASHGRSLLVVRYGDRASCYLNRCPHEDKALNRWQGRFFTPDESHLVCGWHGALFTLEEGNCVAGPCFGQRLKRISICLDGEDIYLAEKPDG